MFVPR